jgi:hypothetical protein
MRAWSFVSLCAAGVALVSTPFAFAGCTGSTEQPADAGSDVDSGASDDAATEDGPSCEQNPNKYPSIHQPIPQLTNLGGPILDHPKIVTVTFAGDQKRDALRAFDHYIVTTDWWHQTAGGYTISDGVNGGDYEVPDTVSGKSITDDDIQTWLQQMIAAGMSTNDAGVSTGLPTPDAQTMYAIYYPHSTTISLQGTSSCAQFGAYHNSATITLEAGTVQAAYSVMPKCNYYNDPKRDFDLLTVSASHEFAEAATDPHPLGANETYRLTDDDSWNTGGAFGAECGDMCEYLPDVAYDENGYQVQRIWSNGAAAKSQHPCQPAPPNKIYYAAAVRTQKQNIDGHQTYGYMVIARGGSMDAQVDVFSEAALPHDVLLYVGKDKGQNGSPSDMASPDDGITASLSTSTGVHNGNCVTLTVNVPKNAVPGDHRIQVRAVLNNGDYNDWPLIIRVK